MVCTLWYAPLSNIEHLKKEDNERVEMLTSAEGLT
jgi:hypothetical protein